MKSLRQLLIEIEVDPQAQASANAVLLVQNLRSNPEVMQMLDQIYLPTDKYKAVKKFAELLGISGERFNDFMQQQSINSNQTNQ